MTELNTPKRSDTLEHIFGENKEGTNRIAKEVARLALRRGRRFIVMEDSNYRERERSSVDTITQTGEVIHRAMHFLERVHPYGKRRHKGGKHMELDNFLRIIILYLEHYNRRICAV